jgi:hypothetical protein
MLFITSESFSLFLIKAHLTPISSIKGNFIIYALFIILKVFLRNLPHHLAHEVPTPPLFVGYKLELRYERFEVHRLGEDFQRLELYPVGGSSQSPFREES